jgi:hypothetical protein
VIEPLVKELVRLVAGQVDDQTATARLRQVVTNLLPHAPNGRTLCRFTLPDDTAGQMPQAGVRRAAAWRKNNISPSVVATAIFARTRETAVVARGAGGADAPSRE